MQLCAKSVFEFSFARLILNVFMLLLRKYGLSMYTCPPYFHESYKKQRDKNKISIDSFIYCMEWHLCLKNILSLKQAIVATKDWSNIKKNHFGLKPFLINEAIIILKKYKVSFNRSSVEHHLLSIETHWVTEI